MNADVSFLVESITQNIGAMISANVSVMNQQNIVCAKKIMLAILAYGLASVTNIVTFVNT